MNEFQALRYKLTHPPPICRIRAELMTTSIHLESFIISISCTTSVPTHVVVLVPGTAAGHLASQVSLHTVRVQLFKIGLVAVADLIITLTRMDRISMI